MQDLTMEPLIGALLEGDTAEALAQSLCLRESGVGIEDIVTQGVEAAMLALDGKCTLEQFNLLEIMLAGRAVMEVMKQLCPPGTALPGDKGKVVIATLEGDVHDLGKNILKMVLTGNGYRVVDCGRDCPLLQLAETVEKEKPVAVCVSGLLSPIAPLVRQIRPLLQERGRGEVKILAGGAALKQISAEWLNVDYVGETAFDGVRFIAEIEPGRDR